VQRWMLGSVTTDLLREGRISVLVVPPAGTRE
jgi:nucleotide-binding universal stress UspA family protein